jgi:hypothetical protein
MNKKIDAIRSELRSEIEPLNEVQYRWPYQENEISREISTIRRKEI